MKEIFSLSLFNVNKIFSLTFKCLEFLSSSELPPCESRHVGSPGELDELWHSPGTPSNELVACPDCLPKEQLCVCLLQHSCSDLTILPSFCSQNTAELCSLNCLHFCWAGGWSVSPLSLYSPVCLKHTPKHTHLISTLRSLLTRYRLVPLTPPRVHVCWGQPPRTVGYIVATH